MRSECDTPTPQALDAVFAATAGQTIQILHRKYSKQLPNGQENDRIRLRKPLGNERMVAFLTICSNQCFNVQILVQIFVQILSNSNLVSRKQRLTLVVRAHGGYVRVGSEGSWPV